MNIDKRPQGLKPGGNRIRSSLRGSTGLNPATLAGKDPSDQRGFDPYNSGTFDRRNNWARVGKR
jgi:hypothetical protein